MKPIFKWAALVAASCAVTAVVHPRLARSADHLDSPAVKADPAGDINDLYSWMDGNNADNPVGLGHHFVDDAVDG